MALKKGILKKGDVDGEGGEDDSDDDDSSDDSNVDGSDGDKGADEPIEKKAKEKDPVEVKKKEAKERLKEYKSLSHFSEKLEFEENPSSKDTNNLEKKYGYDFNLYLTGRKNFDCMIHIWHASFMILCLGVIMLGIFLRWFTGVYMIKEIQSMPSFAGYSSFVAQVTSDTGLHFSGYTKDVGVNLILFNSISVAAALSYLLYPCHKFSFTIPLIVIANCIVLVFEMAFINISYNSELSKTDNITKKLQRQLKDEYKIKGVNDFSVSYDYYSIWLKCCGILDQHDFKDANLEPVEFPGQLSLKVAPVCCRRELFEESGATGQKAILACASEGRPIYKEGCLTVIMEKLAHLGRYYSACAIVRIMDTAIHAYIYRRRLIVMEMVLVVRFGYSPFNKR